MISARTAPSRYVRITEGPARLMVTLLPKNRPTPMAPPIAIMESWRSVNWRCRFWDGCAASAASLPPEEVFVIGILARLSRRRLNLGLYYETGQRITDPRFPAIHPETVGFRRGCCS